MLKKTIITLLALVFAVLLVVPATANAQVVVGVGVGRVYPRPYGYVAVSPGPVSYTHLIYEPLPNEKLLEPVS